MPTFTFQDIFKSSFLERLDAVSLPAAVLALALVAAARHRSLRLIALVCLGLVAAACGWAASQEAFPPLVE